MYRLAQLAAVMLLWPSTGDARRRNRGQDPITAPCVGDLSSVVTTNSSNVYLRSAFDTDPSIYLGRFLPEDAASLNESMARTTRCSEFITTRHIDGGGVSYDHVYQASSEAAVNIGVPGMGGGGVSGGQSAMVRVQYTLTDKMVAEVSDPAAFEDCCKAAPDQCSSLYVGEFIGGTGQIMCGVGEAASFDLDVIGSGVITDMSVKHGALWRSSVTFENPVYFAFRATEAWTSQEAGCGDWITQAPRSTQGAYFVGVADPMESESVARQAALRNAQIQVFSWAQQSVQTSSSGSSSYSGSSAEVSESTVFSHEGFSGVISMIKDENWCVEPEATPHGTRYKVYVLTFLENEQVEAVKQAVGATGTGDGPDREMDIPEGGEDGI